MGFKRYATILIFFFFLPRTQPVKKSPASYARRDRAAPPGATERPAAVRKTGTGLARTDATGRHRAKKRYKKAFNPFDQVTETPGMVFARRIWHLQFLDFSQLIGIVPG